MSYFSICNCLINKDGNFSRYVLYACTKKEPQKPPEHTSEHVKHQNFSGGVPPDPTPTIYIMGPALCICPGPLPSSRRPWDYVNTREVEGVVQNNFIERLRVLAVFQGLVNSKAVQLDLDLKLCKLLFILINAKWTIIFAIPQIRATMVYFQVSSAGPPYKF